MKLKLSAAVEAVNAALDANVPPFVWGAPGVGKSDVIKALAKRRGATLADIRLSMFDPVDLRGLPAAVNGETVWLKPAIWPSDPSRETILFFDEMDRASPAVMAAALQIVLDRRIGEHALPDSVRVIAAGNGKTDRTGTNKISGALANRFLHLNVAVDPEAWQAWAATAGVHPLIAGFLKFRPALLHVETMDRATPAPADELAFPSPRAWERAAKFVGQPLAVRHALIAGLVGDTVAAEFEAFAEIAEELPRLEAIIADPHGAPVPSNPSALYAVSTALARKASVTTFDNVLAYARRLPKEFEIVTAVDAVKRDKALCETGAYVDWAHRNQAVTL